MICDHASPTTRKFSSDRAPTEYISSSLGIGKTYFQGGYAG